MSVNFFRFSGVRSFWTRSVKVVPGAMVFAVIRNGATSLAIYCVNMETPAGSAGDDGTFSCQSLWPQLCTAGITIWNRRHAHRLFSTAVPARPCSTPVTASFKATTYFFSITIVSFSFPDFQLQPVASDYFRRVCATLNLLSELVPLACSQVMPSLINFSMGWSRIMPTPAMMSMASSMIFMKHSREKMPV